VDYEWLDVLIWMRKPRCCRNWPRGEKPTTSSSWLPKTLHKPESVWVGVGPWAISLEPYSLLLRAKAKEYLYVIQGTNLDGVPIYSKGKLLREAGEEAYYFSDFFQEGILEKP